MADSEQENDVMNEFENGNTPSIIDINVEVKISNRKSSSIDSEYDEYIRKYANDEYLSKLDVTEEKNTMVKNDFPVSKDTREEIKGSEVIPCQSCESCIQNQPNANVKLTAAKRKDEMEEEMRSKAEFWRGYGSNIYFQPMTCNTLPLSKSKHGSSQMLRFSKRSLQKKQRTLSPMKYRMDFPSVQEILSNLGTLKMDDTDNYAKREDACSGRSSTRNRVGNFVMSEDLRKGLCKGFVCRSNSGRGNFVGESIQWPNFENETNTVNVEVTKLRRTDKSSKPISDMLELNPNEKDDMFYTGKVPSGGFTSWSLKSFQNHREKSPKKKIIQGRTYHLSNSLQSINRVNLIPFRKPIICKVLSEIKKDPSEHPLHPSPVPSVDEADLEQKVLADHLQEMKLKDHVKSKSLPNEERYAYYSALYYYKDKSGPQKPSKMENFLSTTSLLSEAPEASKRFTKTVSRGSDKQLERRITHHGTDKLDDVHVIGKQSLPFGLNPANNYERYGNKSNLYETFGLGLPSSTLQDYSITDHIFKDPPSSIDGDSMFLSDKAAETSKGVHFDEDSAIKWPKDMNSTFPLETASAKLIDRYEIPVTSSCRLPIIGQKLSTKI